MSIDDMYDIVLAVTVELDSNNPKGAMELLQPLKKELEALLQPGVGAYIGIN